MEIIFKIIAAVSSVYGIYRGVQEVLLKKASNNLEQIYKYFSIEKIKELEKEPPYIGDMACKTVSFLRRFKFREISFILKNKKIDFEELNHILWLVQYKILKTNDNEVIVNTGSVYYPLLENKNVASNKKERIKIWFLKFRTGRIFICFLWISYISVTLLIGLYFIEENPLLAIVFMVAFQVIVQVPLMLYQEKIRSIKNYIKKEINGSRKIDDLLKKINS